MLRDKKDFDPFLHSTLDPPLMVIALELVWPQRLVLRLSLKLQSWQVEEYGRMHSLLVLPCIAHRPGGEAVNSALFTLDVFLLVCLFACLLDLSCCAFKSILLPLSFGT